MTSKKRLKQRIRWYEKAFVQLEAERDEAVFEQRMAAGGWDRDLNSLQALEAATGGLLDAMGEIDGAFWPTLAPHIKELRRLLYGPEQDWTDDLPDEAPNLRKAAEKPRVFERVDKPPHWEFTAEPIEDGAA